MASTARDGRSGFGAFLGDALASLRDPRWRGVALLLFIFLGATNAILASARPVAGEAPGALFAVAGLVRLVAVLWISVAALRIAAGSPRRPWWPDGGFWLYFLLSMLGLAVTAAGTWLGRGLPDLQRILLVEPIAVAALVPFAIWFVAAAVEKPLAWRPSFRGIRSWLPPLLLGSLLLVAPLAIAHAWFSLRLLATVGTNRFWGVVAYDAIASALFVLLALALRVAAYRRVAQA